jgi:hypothetical protein
LIVEPTIEYGNGRQDNSVELFRREEFDNPRVTHLPTIQYKEYTSHIYSTTHTHKRHELNLSASNFSIAENNHLLFMLFTFSFYSINLSNYNSLFYSFITISVVNSLKTSDTLSATETLSKTLAYALRLDDIQQK